MKLGYFQRHFRISIITTLEIKCDDAKKICSEVVLPERLM